MKLPRWTVYPALAVIGTLLITALPHTSDNPKGSEDAEGAALRARGAIVDQATGGELQKLKELSKARTQEILDVNNSGDQ